MREQQISVTFTTYQAGKLFLIGTRSDGQLSAFERTFERCMGLCASSDAQTLWMSTLYQLWRFENVLPKAQLSLGGYDALYVPQLAYTTGDLDIHDTAFGANSRTGRDDAAQLPTFANTLFSCLAQPSETHSFRPVWNPPFITRLAAEDRCHLNGFAMRDGIPAFVTAASGTNIHEGWREHRRSGGVVIDVASGEVISRGLSMPHSPRWHDGQLYLLNSGAGEFGTIDLASGKFEPICFCAGYARGLVLFGNFALIGLSNCREDRTFTGLPLNDALAEKQVQPRCGVIVVDLRTGDIAHSLAVTGIVRELYDVAILPKVQMPSALGFRTEEIRRTISIEE
jgi:uncharacterized protein (TIGR03032 family)